MGTIRCSSESEGEVAVEETANEKVETMVSHIFYLIPFASSVFNSVVLLFGFSILSFTDYRKRKSVAAVP